MEKLSTYTNLTQARKLKKLGLKSETSDLLWIYKPVNRYELKEKCWESVSRDIPCWSVGALAKLLPNSIDYNGVQYFRKSDFDHIFYVAGYWNGGYHYSAFKSTDKLKFEDPTFKHVYNTVVWLLENNLIDEKYINK